MRIRFPRMRAAGLVAAALVLLVAAPAWAHHPEIEAEAICDTSTGEIIILYTSTAWDTDQPLARQNDQIDIYVDGVLVDSGAFNDPDYSFSGEVPAPGGAVEGDVIVVSAIAVDSWGTGREGGQSESTTVTIPSGDCTTTDALGRFTGGGHQIRVDGVRVTRGLTIHCDLLLSNNLEINWNGNHFHMLDHMTTVACTDDPDITQAPPEAPLDTLIGVGEGRYNNDGLVYTIEFTLVDQGEPGVDDQMAILIYETANPGNVILDVPLQVLSGGNLQAHYDQPHR